VSERDPRKDPVDGDVMEISSEFGTVSYRVTCAHHGSVCFLATEHHMVSREEFARWMAGARVIKTG
jgi:hypothetical protein